MTVEWKARKASRIVCGDSNNLEVRIMEILSSRAGRLCRKLIAVSSTVLVVLWSVPNQVDAAAGDLDPSFGIGGKVTTPSSAANSLAIQTDGKLVVVGF